MIQKYDLQKVSIHNLLHDERIHRIELKDKKLILHYDELHFSDKYRKCHLIFDNVDEADLIVEIREKKDKMIKSSLYYDAEFLEFINSHNYCIESIEFYYGYETVIVQAALVNQVGMYCEDCILKISATEMLYHWE